MVQCGKLHKHLSSKQCILPHHIVMWSFYLQLTLIRRGRNYILGIYAREKIPVVTFGSGIFWKKSMKFKGHRIRVTDVLYRALKRKEAQGDIIVVTVDEFRTSRVQDYSLNILLNSLQVCSSCNQIVFTTSLLNFHNIQSCSGCGLLWKRDINASKNIFKIMDAVDHMHSVVAQIAVLRTWFSSLSLDTYCQQAWCQNFFFFFEKDIDKKVLRINSKI